ncbi:ARF/SAR superfamily [Penicillium sp. IBT 35674x]|nr:ARF/SAR superfamily [Penicillium sp. IBT 35674x]
MGLTLSRLFGDKLWERKTVRIIIVGLHEAGKSTILHKMNAGEVVTTTPAPGFNVKTVQYKNVHLTSWATSGPDDYRPLWKNYYQDTQAIIFVVDSDNHHRINEARYELERLLNEDALRDALLLVCANKQDMATALSTAEVAEKLALQSLKQHWYIQATCATSGDGIYEGIEWLVNSLKRAGY